MYIQDVKTFTYKAPEELVQHELNSRTYNGLAGLQEVAKNPNYPDWVVARAAEDGYFRNPEVPKISDVAKQKEEELGIPEIERRINRNKKELDRLARKNATAFKDMNSIKNSLTKAVIAEDKDKVESLSKAYLKVEERYDPALEEKVRQDVKTDEELQQARVEELKKIDLEVERKEHNFTGMLYSLHPDFMTAGVDVRKFLKDNPNAIDEEYEAAVERLKSNN